MWEKLLSCVGVETSKLCEKKILSCMRGETFLS